MDGWMDGWMAATVTIINQPILAPIPSFLSIGDLREKKKKKKKNKGKERKNMDMHNYNDGCRPTIS